MQNVRAAVAAVLAGTLAGMLAAAPAHAASERQQMEELRNTVINLLQTLVDQGVMSREKAQALVQEAQQKAATDAATAAAADEGAVRVTYVPQTVRDEISKQVAQEVRPQLVDDVVERAKRERWGVPAALPEWLGRFRWSGDVRVRAEAALYADANLPQTRLDFLAINAAGGIDRAGVAAFANTTETRQRLRVQARLGVRGTLGEGVTAGARLVTGNLDSPVSENNTLGAYEGKLSVGFDQAFLRWDAMPARHFGFTLQGGRFDNPWTTTDLIFDRDLAFDGVSLTLRTPFGDSSERTGAYLTLGAHPLEEVELAARDKWLYGAQLGVDLALGEQRFRIASAYYDFRNVQGRRNPFDSVEFDYTAPRYLQRGNTMFDIRNDLATDTNLFALAGKYELVDALVSWDGPAWNDVRFGLTGHYVRNIGWKAEDVRRIANLVADERTDGYSVELSLGHRNALEPGRWRAFFQYRYLQRDAVLDAFTDSDFGLGGTDLKGYVLGADVGLYRNMWLRVRYLTADEIDGTLFGVGGSQFPVRFPFGVDVFQLDVSAQF